MSILDSLKDLIKKAEEESAQPQPASDSTPVEGATGAGNTPSEKPAVEPQAEQKQEEQKVDTKELEELKAKLAEAEKKNSEMEAKQKEVSKVETSPSPTPKDWYEEYMNMPAEQMLKKETQQKLDEMLLRDRAKIKSAR